MRGPYGKLWTEFFSFLLWPKREVRGPWKEGRKKRGSITCRTNRANEANKMFIIWLCWLFRFWKGDRELEVRTATYGPGIDQSQHAKSVSHIIICSNNNIYNNTYLLLAECEVRTASCGPSFFLPFMAQARSARAMKTRKEKTRIHNLPYGSSKRG